MAVAIDARVSSRKQDQASQLPDLERYAKRVADEGEEVLWYRDKHTGKTMDRPGWNAAAAAIRSGRVDRIVVWRIDRLGRTSSGLALLFDELIARNVNLVSIRDGVELGTPTGRMVAGILASVAVYETEVRGERTVAGQEVARAKGKPMGWPGGKHTPIKANDDRRVIVARLRDEGAGVAAISLAAGLARDTVYKILESAGQLPRHRGRLRYLVKKRLAPGPHRGRVASPVGPLVQRPRSGPRPGPPRVGPGPRLAENAWRLEESAVTRGRSDANQSRR
jgi:DNA invertase Pin-like site-specific DNA recombinase